MGKVLPFRPQGNADAGATQLQPSSTPAFDPHEAERAAVWRVARDALGLWWERAHMDPVTRASFSEGIKIPLRADDDVALREGLGSLAYRLQCWLLEHRKWTQLLPSFPPNLSVQAAPALTEQEKVDAIYGRVSQSMLAGRFTPKGVYESVEPGGPLATLHFLDGDEFWSYFRKGDRAAHKAGDPALVAVVKKMKDNGLFVRDIATD